MPEDNLPQRTMKTGACLIGFLAVCFAAYGDNRTALGLLIGGAVGIFSLWTLTFVIPRLFHPGGAGSKFLLGAVTLLKLPLYAVTINFAVTSRFVSPFAVFVGVALIPAVVVLKILGQQWVIEQKPRRSAAGEETCQKNPARSN